MRNQFTLWRALVVARWTAMLHRIAMLHRHSAEQYLRDCHDATENARLSMIGHRHAEESAYQRALDANRAAGRAELHAGLGIK